jgi:hypothetical protein
MLTKSLREGFYAGFSKHEIVTILETALALKADYGSVGLTRCPMGEPVQRQPVHETRNSFEAEYSN